MKRTMFIMGMVLLTGCGSTVERSFSNAFAKSDIVYQASTRFMYSTDGGVQWSETIQEIPVDATYYMTIEMKISQSEETSEEKIVRSNISIPNTTVLDCYLDDHPGVSITGQMDNERNCVVYEFNIVSGISPSVFRVVFECMPLSEGRVNVEVVYDDNVSESWDATGVVKYVAGG